MGAKKKKKREEGEEREPTPEKKVRGKVKEDIF